MKVSVKNNVITIETKLSEGRHTLKDEKGNELLKVDVKENVNFVFDLSYVSMKALEDGVARCVVPTQDTDAETKVNLKKYYADTLLNLKLLEEQDAIAQADKEALFNEIFVD